MDEVVTSYPSKTCVDELRYATSESTSVGDGVVEASSDEEHDGEKHELHGRKGKIVKKQVQPKMQAPPVKKTPERIPNFMSCAVRTWSKQFVKCDLKELSETRTALCMASCIRALDRIRSRIDDGFYDEGVRLDSHPYHVFKALAVYNDITAQLQRSQCTALVELVQSMKTEFIEQLHGLAERLRDNDLHGADSWALAASVSYECLASAQHSVGNVFGMLCNAFDPSNFRLGGAVDVQRVGTTVVRHVHTNGVAWRRMNQRSQGWSACESLPAPSHGNRTPTDAYARRASSAIVPTRIARQVHSKKGISSWPLGRH